MRIGLGLEVLDSFVYLFVLLYIYFSRINNFSCLREIFINILSKTEKAILRMSTVPGEAPCFNLNFTNPGGTGPIQSLLLSPKQTVCFGFLYSINFRRIPSPPRTHTHIRLFPCPINGLRR